MTNARIRRECSIAGTEHVLNLNVIVMARTGRTKRTPSRTRCFPPVRPDSDNAPIMTLVFPTSGSVMAVKNVLMVRMKLTVQVYGVGVDVPDSFVRTISATLPG